MVAAIRASAEPVTLLCLAPLCNVAAMLDRAGDDVASRVRLVSMQGSVRKGYDGSPRTSAEHNVACDPAACARALAAPWLCKPLLAPLDTCGLFWLREPQLRRLAGPAAAPLVGALLEANRAWMQDSRVARRHYRELDAAKSSTVLFDVLAAFLALHPDGGGLVEVRSLQLKVADDGRTVEGEVGPHVQCAMDWLGGGPQELGARVVDALLGAQENAGAPPRGKKRPAAAACGEPKL
mmetsp:Transcript_72722/g.235298  ORF Transcript_72722/g.235298 Transcript_72722/m.235298 type:complete len:237 (-) Transcript_72722:26-736(-)